MLTNNRHKTHAVQIGHVNVGGGHPIVVQSMTNTDTADVEATAQQSFELWKAGSEMVRITVDRPDSARAVPYIRDRLVQLGWENPLLIGDFHYIGHTLLSDYKDCAEALAKYRINPGNVGFGNKHDAQFSMIIEQALRYEKPIRIGVNWGSLDQDLLAQMMDANALLKEPKNIQALTQEALVVSALSSARAAENLGMPSDRIIISCKASQVQDLIVVYRALAQRSNYALHLGLTEAGMDTKGIIATTAAFSVLLQEGIGDTIRASLTPVPGGDRTTEVRVCQEILQSMGLRSFMPSVTACPGCGRTTSTVFQTLAQTIQQKLRENLPEWKKQNPRVVDLRIAVMGCVVNGPGESKHAHLGISLPGTGEAPAAPVFIDGKKAKVLRGDHIADEFIKMIETYVHQMK